MRKSPLLDWTSCPADKRGLPLYIWKEVLLYYRNVLWRYSRSRTHPLSQNKDFLCHYRGMYYELGSTVSLSTKQGIECTCKVPPDFTCVRK
ncbi:hypothetical protein CEXT_409681 [Caerostris extrusa]|uniref:Uncharacterized protein n=1 Tax=Caerostris extrusa TaxID=172846 RepID=A0AAV4T1L6_CAEEX|nr:hypothetical protein CEXT_409681 [Caerostris extrusa]